MILLLTSLEILGNVKIIPFLGSIALLLTTYFFTNQITNNRLAGIIAMLVLIQSYTFLRYDSFAMYENFWVLLMSYLYTPYVKNGNCLQFLTFYQFSQKHLQQFFFHSH